MVYGLTISESPRSCPPPKKMFVIQNEQNNGSLKQFKTFFSAKHLRWPPLWWANV
jgi:hypothetical protein